MTLHASHRLDPFAWPKRVTDAPTGHRVSLRKRAGDDHATAQRFRKLHRRERPHRIVNKLAVTLIRDHPQPTADSQGHDLFEFIWWHNEAGRIRGRVYEQQFRAAGQ